MFVDCKAVNCMSLETVHAKKYFVQKYFLKLSWTCDLYKFIWLRNLICITSVNYALCALYRFIRIFHKSYFEFVPVIIKYLSVITSTF